jgi:hypothetical protein
MGCLEVHEITVASPWLLECFKTKRVLSTRWRAQSGGKSESIWSSSRRVGGVLQKAKWVGQSGFKMQLIVKIVSIIYQNDLFVAG